MNVEVLAVIHGAQQLWHVVNVSQPLNCRMLPPQIQRSLCNCRRVAVIRLTRDHKINF